MRRCLYMCVQYNAQFQKTEHFGASDLGRTCLNLTRHHHLWNKTKPMKKRESQTGLEPETSRSEV